VKPFGGLEDWRHPRGSAISLSGFKSGTANTISVTADATHPAPDLDWIEVVNSDSTVPQTGLCQPSLWNVTASVNSSDASNAVSSSGSDRWSTNRAMKVGDYYQIDFTGTVHLSTLTMDNRGGSPNDFPATYAVYSSSDGCTFSSTPFATGSGTPTQTVISFPEETVRAIRIKVTATTSNYWSILNFQTDCSL
jgi:hypothetical protein